MSAPENDLEKQAKSHRPALGGISIALVIGLVALIAIIVTAFFRGTPPEGAETQINGATGAVIETE